MLTRRIKTGIVFSPGLACIAMIAIAPLLHRTTQGEGLTIPKLELTSRSLEDTGLPALQVVPASPASGDESV